MAVAPGPGRSPPCGVGHQGRRRPAGARRRSRWRRSRGQRDHQPLRHAGQEERGKAGGGLAGDDGSGHALATTRAQVGGALCAVCGGDPSLGVGRAGAADPPLHRPAGEPHQRAVACPRSALADRPRSVARPAPGGRQEPAREERGGRRARSSRVDSESADRRRGMGSRAHAGAWRARAGIARRPYRAGDL